MADLSEEFCGWVALARFLESTPEQAEPRSEFVTGGPVFRCIRAPIFCESTDGRGGDCAEVVGMEFDWSFATLQRECIEAGMVVTKGAEAWLS